MTMEYGTSLRLAGAPFDETLARVREALKDQGFGVLTEIDVRATLEEKLGEQMEPYVILGACNPPLAHRALAVDRRIGLLLPCNVVVRADGDTVVVDVLAPQIMVSLTGRPELEPIAAEAGKRLTAALNSLSASADATEVRR